MKPAFFALLSWNPQLFHILGKSQVRFSHTDINMPDFGDYRRETTRDTSLASQSDLSRRAFTYMVVAGMGVTGVHVGKNILIDFLSTMSASADVLAMAKIEVDLESIPEGTLRDHSFLIHVLPKPWCEALLTNTVLLIFHLLQQHFRVAGFEAGLAIASIPQ